MSGLIIPIDGESTYIETKYIKISELILDQENPRISFFKDNQLSDKLSDNQIVHALKNKNRGRLR